MIMDDRKEYWDSIIIVSKYLDDIRKAKDDIHIKFQERLLLVTTSVFAILVAFHTKNASSEYIYLFIGAIISLSICILSGIFALYGFLDAFKTLNQKTGKWVREFIEQPTVARPEFKIKCRYKISEIIFYTFFVISILLLASYSVLSLTTPASQAL